MASVLFIWHKRSRSIPEAFPQHPRSIPEGSGQASKRNFELLRSKKARQTFDWRQSIDSFVFSRQNLCVCDIID